MLGAGLDSVIPPFKGRPAEGGCSQAKGEPEGGPPPGAALADNSPMYSPSQDDVRRFFCDVWSRRRDSLPLDPMQARAAHWIAEHPEYDPDLSDLQAALAARYTIEEGRTNPFLHLSMHLSLAEQVAIDQPTGIRQAYEQLCARWGSAHEAHHRMMECLGEMIWTSQRSGLPPDGLQYLACVRRLARG